MYICRETIRTAIAQKFHEVKQWNCQNFSDLKEDINNYIMSHQNGRKTARTEINHIINSLKICDPSVGSGHFLVSALNEVISIKQELGILQDHQGETLSGYQIEVVNDELIITDNHENFFAYNPQNKESQRIQKTLFHEKQTIIENCLFGVDINPNSVKICRLRLWIELLKNAYYQTEETQKPGFFEKPGFFPKLQTLPNIDIKIKCGNSLISRFPLNDQVFFSPVVKQEILTYKKAVTSYFNTQDKSEKRQIKRSLKKINDTFRTSLQGIDPKKTKLRNLESELFDLEHPNLLFEETTKEKKAREKKINKLQNEIDKLRVEIEKIDTGKIYQNAFEWRFEFPEVLNDQGEFIGFDVIIGNPPYGIELSTIEKNHIKYNSQINDISWNTAYIFIELGKLIIKKNGYLSYIIPKGIAYVPNLENVRQFLCKQFFTTSIIDTSESFTSSGVQLETVIILLKNDSIINNYKITTGYVIDQKFLTSQVDSNIVMTSFKLGVWLTETNYSIIEKINSQSVKLGDIYESKRGIGLNKYIQNQQENIDDLILIGGKYIERYFYSGITFVNAKYIKNNHQWVKDKPKIILQEIVGRYGKPLFGNFRKIKLNANIDYEGIYTLDTVVNLFKKNNNYLEEYVLGLLNSKLMSWYFHTYMSCFSQLTLHSGNENSRNLPIKINDKTEQLAISSLVTQILTLKKSHPDTDTSKLEREIDLLVYELYGLTEEEIKIIEGEII
jgi:adenine-specific DNA-methyltransferase